MGKNHVITVGINSYRNLPSLKYAKQDAEAIRDCLHHSLDFTVAYHFSDDSLPISQDFGPELDSHPTYATLRRFLRVRFDKPFLGSGDTLWFFFAGHGIRYQDRDYLIPIDGDSGDIEATTISLYYIAERLQRSGADNIVMFIDACRSTLGQRGIGIGLEQQKGVITFFSCRPEESSYEIDELKHGAFTYCLLRWLKLEEKANCSTVGHLHDFLCNSVPEINKKYLKPTQIPYGRVEPLIKAYLILFPHKATSNDVELLKKEALRAELTFQYSIARQFWLCVLQVIPADLDAVEGLERLAQVDILTHSSQAQASELTFFKHFQEDTSIKLKAITKPDLRPNFDFETATVDKNGKIVARSYKQAKYYREELDDNIFLDLVFIPSGSFLMGSPSYEDGRKNCEEPLHHVTISAFFMGKYPVTQAQWWAVAALPKVECDLNRNPSSFTGKNLPVETVTKYEAIEFCARLSRHSLREYRLPSESEWEYACRSGTNTSFYFGNKLTPDIANYTYGDGYNNIYQAKTTRVGNFKFANSFGLYDMHGNVREWCSDHWHCDYAEAPIDGSAWIEDIDDICSVIRGGSWNEYSWGCRSAYRSYYYPNFRDDGLGFRIACSHV